MDWTTVYLVWATAGILGMAWVSWKIDKYIALPYEDIILRCVISGSLGVLYPLYWYLVYLHIKNSPVSYILLLDRAFSPRPKSFWSR